MLEVKGVIQDIVTENNNGRDKKVVALRAGKNNTLFIEFQGSSVNWLNGFNTGDNVSVKIRFNGKISGLGRRYNNLVARGINKA